MVDSLYLVEYKSRRKKKTLKQLANFSSFNFAAISQEYFCDYLRALFLPKKRILVRI